MGKYIVDCGRQTNILLVLNNIKSYGARVIEGWFDTGPAQILIAKEMCKPDNSMVLMKITRKMLGLDEGQYREYNVDDEFLAKPIDILIEVKHCAVVTTPIDEITRKGYLHPHLNLMETNTGKGYSLQGTFGGNGRDFSHPIISKWRKLQLT